jgi:sodium/proline symporter
VLSDLAGRYPIFGLYELAPGFVLAFVAMVAVSLVTRKPSKEMVAEFDSVSGK